MASCPNPHQQVQKDVENEITRLRDLFYVSPEKLKYITQQFQIHLKEGLARDNGPIPMIPTWCMGEPSGLESGTILALDLGGTNIRACKIELTNDKGKFNVEQCHFRIPDSLKSGSAENFFSYIVDVLEKFLKHIGNVENGKVLPLGFTFSYPVTQHYINQGILQRWTKGFSVQDVENTDVVEPLERLIAERKLPIKLVALINDTTGTLIATAYGINDVKIGCIFGTGCNAAYVEDLKCIGKLKQYKDSPGQMVINCEWGAFDNECKILPRTPYDVTLDKQSPHVGQQIFEKMVAGNYLGEIFRLALLDSTRILSGKIFADQEEGLRNLEKPYILDSSFPSLIEGDPTCDLVETFELFKNKLGITLKWDEAVLVRRLAQLIGARAARLSACGVAAIFKNKDWPRCRVGADGSLFLKYPMFKDRCLHALGEILDWPQLECSSTDGVNPDDVGWVVHRSTVKYSTSDTCDKRPIEFVSALDGSGVGAGIVSLLTLADVREGRVDHVRNWQSMKVLAEKCNK